MSHLNELNQQEDASSIAQNGSVASSNASQTRFSFYNAEEFRVTTQQQQPNATSTNHNHAGNNSTTNSSRFNFYDPQELRITQTVVETMHAQQQQKAAITTTAALNQTEKQDREEDDNHHGGLDSDDILKSLQEHEQQRLEILSGPRSLQQQQQNSNMNDSNMSTMMSSHATTNPYEDAIQEALELLRKHRSHSSLNTSLEDAAAEDHDAVTMLRPRSAPNAASHENRSSFADTTEDHNKNNNNNINRHLGQAYQDEIQARRKQRQERMAKYATRLAELKQQNNNNNNNNTAHFQSSPPDVKTTRSLDSPPSSTYARQFRNEKHLHQETPLYDHILANRSESSTTMAPQEIVPSLTGECSVSTLSNHEDVQRGVERVLLAILERANNNHVNSSGRSYENSNSSVNQNANDEEKKSTGSMVSTERRQQQQHSASNSRHSNNDDALLRAVTEILGPTISPPVIMSTTTDEHDNHDDNEEDDDISFATQGEPPPVDSSDSGGLLNITQPDHDSENEGMVAIETPLEIQEDTLKTTDFLRHHRITVTTPGSIAEKESNKNMHNAGPLNNHHLEPLPSHREEVDPLVEQVLLAHAIELSSSAAVTTNGNNPSSSSSSLSKPQTRIPTDSDHVRNNSVNDTGSSGRNSNDSNLAVSDSDNDDHVGEEKSTTVNDQSSIVASSDDSDGDSYNDENDDDDESSHEYPVSSKNDKTKYISALGPLSKKAGGRTGVVLENSEHSVSSSSYTDDDSEENVKASTFVNGGSPSILESITAAVSLVTGGRPSNLEGKQIVSRKDRYMSASSSEEEDETDDDDAIEANDLMRSLCAHLLPVGVDSKPNSRILDKIPDWDDSNPDEPGYRIIRLNSYQLRCVERAYDNMIDKLHRKSRRKLGGRFDPDESTDETAFERDLRAAEDLLDEEEKRLKASGGATVPTLEEASSVGHSSVVLENGDEAHEVTFEAIGKAKSDEFEYLPNFPGVKPAGRGEMGDLEYFTLPIIFKSNVTGFEPTKDMVLEPGNVVAGQYLVEGVLGSAAFSTAYKCIDLNSDEDSTGEQEEVCLKVIKNTKDFFDQSLDEIKILELLRQTGKCHENHIIEMKTFFYHREHLIIVTELLRQNLFEFGKFIIDSGEEPYFTIDRLSYVTRQCLIALKFIHAIGLVHSDVKPENILLSSYSRAQVKLIDFGSSCYLTDRQSSYIQSRSYRAPEVILGLPYDGRIDIWSIGCVVAEMYTGEVTFQNDSVVSMLSRIEAICGPFPRHMITQGRQSSRFFTKCGLLYEKVEDDDDGRSHDESRSDDDSHHNDGTRPTHIDIFQPKRTTLSARLGFEPNLMEKYDCGKLLTKEEKKRGMFVDLIRKLLTIDPEARPTAAEALQHPMMVYASTLKEENIKYPSK